MKRTLALVLGLALLAPVVLAGCGDEAAKPADAGKAAPAPAGGTPPAEPK